MSQKTTLSSLPVELRLNILSSLHNIEDFVSLTSSCRAFHSVQDSVPSVSLFRLAAASSRIFFRPSPHFLIAAVASQLGNWARTSSTNALRLKETFLGGIDAVLDLCLDPTTHCGLTLDRIRELHALRFSTLNPVADLIDKCIGSQWYSTPNFWNGGVSDAYTLDSDPDLAIFHLAIYGGLFLGDLELVLAGKHAQQISDRQILGEEVRLEYIKYCVPDWACYGCQGRARRVKMGDGSIDPRRAVRHDIGPYVAFAKGRDRREFKEHGNQIALYWLLQSTRFNTQLASVVRAAGLEDIDDKGWSVLREDKGYGYEDEELWPSWKQEMWENAVLCQGLDSLRLLACAKARWKGPDRVAACGEGDGQEESGSKNMVEVDRGEPELEKLDYHLVERLRDLRGKVVALTDKPSSTRVGTYETYEYPSLKWDLHITKSGYTGD